MCQGSDHPLRRAAREVGVGVKSDNKPNSWQYAEIAHFHRETVVQPAQQSIKIKQLTAFAFPAHPCSFTRVIHAMAMEEKERSHALSGIPLIQFVDQVCA